MATTPVNDLSALGKNPDPQPLGPNPRQIPDIHKLCDDINMGCFKLLGLGATCYVTIIKILITHLVNKKAWIQTPSRPGSGVYLTLPQCS